MKKIALITIIIAAISWMAWILQSKDKIADRQTPAAPNEMRIVSMAPNLTEILYGLGLDKEIVAVSSDSNYPIEAQALPTVGTFWQPDMEAIVKACPTLVAAMGFDQQKALSRRLQRLGCKTLSLNIESFPELYSGIESLGAATGRTAGAHAMIERIQSIQGDFKRRFSERPAPKVLWVIQREPLRVAGVDTFINDMIVVCGGINAIPRTLHQYPPISQESLLSFLPDVIIEPSDTPADFERLTHTCAEFYGRYPSVPAVQNQRIYVLNGDLVSRLGPRIEQGIKQVAKCLWPEETIE